MRQEYTEQAEKGHSWDTLPAHVIKTLWWLLREGRIPLSIRMKQVFEFDWESGRRLCIHLLYKIHSWLG